MNDCFAGVSLSDRNRVQPDSGLVVDVDELFDSARDLFSLHMRSIVLASWNGP